MSSQNKIIVQGAGAMGSAYASRFYDQDPACISFLASGERYQRLKSQGVVVNGKHYPIHVLSPNDAGPPADLIMVALKHQHLESALPDLANFVGEKTTFLSIMNGLDSEEMIASAYGEEKVLLATAIGIDAQRKGNVINFSKGGMVLFGEADNRKLTRRVEHIQAIFDQAGIGYQTPTDMIRTMWWKFMINVGINQASAILSAPYRVFQGSTHARAIMESAMREVIQVAEAAGVNLVEADIQDWYGFLEKLSPAGRTSMLQDVEAGRQTEVDIFGGKMIELGKKYAIPTPVNEVLYHAIKVIEREGKRQNQITKSS